jgi:hypothetical protein
VGLANLGSESETCVGSRVHLVGVFISFEKNFYRLPCTPPSLVRRIGPSACSPALRPPQLTAASLAADRRRSRFLPNQPHQVTEGEFKPHPSSSLARVRPSLAAGQPCSAAGDLIVISVFDRGALLQNDILGFRVESLSLVKSI